VLVDETAECFDISGMRLSMTRADGLSAWFCCFGVRSCLRLCLGTCKAKHLYISSLQSALCLLSSLSLFSSWILRPVKDTQTDVNLVVWESKIFFEEVSLCHLLIDRTCLESFCPPSFFLHPLFWGAPVLSLMKTVETHRSSFWSRCTHLGSTPQVRPSDLFL